MSERTPKRRQSDLKGMNRKILVSWGVPICLLLATLFVLTTNFAAVSSTKAREVIKQRIVTDGQNSSVAISKEMAEMSTAGTTAAALIHEHKWVSEAISVDYAQAIEKTLGSAYMVVIVNKAGQGYCSEGYEVDISGTDYFTAHYRQEYLHTMDDGILHKEAFITMIPVFGQYLHEGMLFIYTPVDDIKEQLPIHSYNSKGSFLIIDNLGSIVSRFGKEQEILEDENFLEILMNAGLKETDYKRVINKIENKAQHYFAFESSKGNYTVSISPTSFNAWYFVTMIPQDEVERLVAAEWEDSRNLNTSIMVTLIAFIVILITMNILGRIQMMRQNKALETKADTDLLTGLSNKIATERLIQEFTEDYPEGQSMFVILDIDNFKKINDTMGHAFGDDILRSLGHQLRSEFRVTDIIGRTGGDEFILFLKFIKTDELLEREGQRILDFFRQFKGGGEYVKYSATASIGVSVFPRDGQDYESLYRTADSALYESKRKGKNQLTFFDKSFEKEATGMRKTAPIDNDGTKEKK